MVTTVNKAMTKATTSKHETMTVVRISPTTAAALLERNTNNRKIGRALVDKYARDMSSGAWQLGNGIICVAGDGELLNGQHRLQAVVQSGVTIEAWLWRGCPKEAAVVFDQGKSRTVGDALHYKGVDIGAKEVGALNMICRYESGDVIYDRKKRQTTASEVLTLMQTNDVATTASHIFTCAHHPGFNLGGALAIYVLLKRGEQIADVSEFMERLRTGEGVRGEPTFTLSRRLLTTVLPSYPEVFIWTVRAYEAWVNNRPATALRVGNVKRICKEDWEPK